MVVTAKKFLKSWRASPCLSYWVLATTLYLLEHNKWPRSPKKWTIWFCGWRRGRLKDSDKRRCILKSCCCNQSVMILFQSSRLMGFYFGTMRVCIQVGWSYKREAIYRVYWHWRRSHPRGNDYFSKDARTWSCCRLFLWRRVVWQTSKKAVWYGNRLFG